jgi:hypothetical protein
MARDYAEVLHAEDVERLASLPGASGPPMTPCLLALAARLFIIEGQEHRQLGRFLASYPARWVEAGSPEHHRAEARCLGRVTARIKARAREARR